MKLFTNTLAAVYLIGAAINLFWQVRDLFRNWDEIYDEVISDELMRIARIVPARTARGLIALIMVGLVLGVALTWPYFVYAWCCEAEGEPTDDEE